MADVNSTTLLGRLTAKPELKQTTSGKSVCSFSVATGKKYKDPNGEWKERAEFHNCVAWEQKADFISQYGDKGAQIFIEGSLSTRSWEDQTGVKKYKTEIVANNVQLFSQKPKQETAPEEEYPF